MFEAYCSDCGVRGYRHVIGMPIDLMYPYDKPIYFRDYLGGEGYCGECYDTREG